ncbi:hypothetical protein FHT70_000403 [Rhizobium sp. BK049]|nr:hypothetical protein [Rhizobium sp. BK049]
MGGCSGSEQYSELYPQIGQNGWHSRLPAVGWRHVPPSRAFDLIEQYDRSGRNAGEMM